MSFQNWLKYAHIMGAIVWIGGGVMLSLVGWRARQSEDVHTIRDFSCVLSYVGLRVLMPSVIFDHHAARILLGRWIAGYQIVLLILVFAVWDMFFKPGI